MTRLYDQQARAIVQGVQAGKVSPERGQVLLAELRRHERRGDSLEDFTDTMAARRLMNPRQGQHRRSNAA